MNDIDPTRLPMRPVPTCYPNLEIRPPERRPMKPLVYLASPYSHPSQHVREQRFEKVSKIAAEILLDGYLLPFSPIAHSHPMAVHGCPPISAVFATDWKAWQELDLAFIDRCDAIVVVQLDGWEQSVGVTAEIDYARSKGMPVIYFNPESMPIGDLRNIAAIVSA